MLLTSFVGSCVDTDAEQNSGQTDGAPLKIHTGARGEKLTG
jgi:hypothetical protein